MSRYFVTVTDPQPRLIALTRLTRQLIRDSRGVGYELPNTLMYTHLFGIVPNTPYNRRRYQRNIVTDISGPSPRQIRLTRRTRQLIRNARGVGYELPDNLIYTNRYGIVANTPQNRLRYSTPATTVQEGDNMPLFDMNENMQRQLMRNIIITYNPAALQAQNSEYPFYSRRLPPNYQPGETPTIDNPPELNNLDRNVIDILPASDLIDIPLYRVQILLVTGVLNNQTNTVERRLDYFPLEIVGMNNVNLSDVIADNIRAWNDIRIGASSYLVPLWIEQVAVHAFRYEPQRGGSYMLFCRYIRSRNAVVNVKNKDDYCLLWSYLACKYPSTRDGQRTSKYARYMPQILGLCRHIDFPIAPENLEKVEKVLSCRFNVYTYHDDTIVPVRFSSQEAINLWYEKKGDNAHYGWIKNISRLTGGSNHVCYRCLANFSRAESLSRHEEVCSGNREAVTIMPNEGEGLQYKKSVKNVFSPLVIYADFESINSPVSETRQNNVISTHNNISYGAYISTNAVLPSPYTDYIGTDCGEKFLKYLFDHVSDQLLRLEERKKETWDFKQVKKYYGEKTCWVCDKEFVSINHSVRKRIFSKSACDRTEEEKETIKNIKVRSSCKITGQPCGLSSAIHYCCKMDLQRRPTIPVVFHNLQGYDANFIIRALSNLLTNDPEWCRKHKLNVGNPMRAIATSYEKFKTFSIGQFKFIDSLAFLPSSLSKLIENLGNNRPNMIKHGLEPCKGAFPYEWLDNVLKLNQPPPREASSYYSQVQGKVTASQEEIDRLADQYPTLQDLLLDYQKRDVIGLADVMDGFRREIYNEHTIDPVHYISLPQLGKDGMLRLYGNKIDLITDRDIYLTAEKGLRGGFCQIGKRYARTSPNSKIIDLDANNLYGLAMMQKLYCGNARWGKLEDYQKALNLDPLGGTGALITIDLEYPKELHERDAMYPLAVTHRTIALDDLSPLQKDKLPTSKRGDPIFNATRKLIGDFRPRINYAVDYRALRFYLDKGLKVTKVHSIIFYDQDYVIKPWILYNTEKRAKSKTEFLKSLYKLLNNSVFGKMMEGVRDRTDMTVHTNAASLRRHLNKHSLKFVKRDIGQHLAMTFCRKPTIMLDKPILIGQAILDLAKLHMHAFLYKLQDHFGQKNIKLLMTDTDSLCFEITTTNLTDDLLRDNFYLREMDTSNYACSCNNGACKCGLFDHPDFQFPNPAAPRGKAHRLYSLGNKKVPGYFKDEYPCGIDEFIGLRSKCYHISSKEHKATAKGVNKLAKRQLTRDVFYNTLFTGESFSVDVSGIRACNFRPVTYQMTKTALTCFDDKRRWTSIIDSIPYS